LGQENPVPRRRIWRKRKGLIHRREDGQEMLGRTIPSFAFPSFLNRKGITSELKDTRDARGGDLIQLPLYRDRF